METLNITPERFQQALAWMNGQASTLGEQEVLQMLRFLTGRFQENCKVLRTGPVARFRNLRITPHPLSLSAIIAETEERIGKNDADPASARTDENPFLKELLGETDAPAVLADAPLESATILTPEQEVMETVARESRLDSVLLINSIAYVGAMSVSPHIF